VEQFLIIFNAFWNKINWIDLNHGFSGRPEWAQKRRMELASILGAAEPGTRYKYSELVHKNDPDASNQGVPRYVHDEDWWYVVGVIPERVLPMLMVMGLVKLDFEQIDSGRFHVVRIDTLQVTPLGKTIFSTIARQ
jgi:hypothetical protein